MKAVSGTRYFIGSQIKSYSGLNRDRITFAIYGALGMVYVNYDWSFRG